MKVVDLDKWFASRYTQDMEVFIVIAAYNEAEVIGQVVDELLRHYPHVVVVDDGSTDRTRELLRDTQVMLISHLVNRGQGAALETGLQVALEQGAEIVVTFDADGQHNVEDIQKLIQPILDGTAEVVFGSRFLHLDSRIPLLRRILLKGGTWLTRFLTGLSVTDTHHGLRAFSRKAAASIHFELDRMGHASEVFEIIARERLRYVEVPARVIYTPYSLKKGQSPFDALKILARLFERSWFR